MSSDWAIHAEGLSKCYLLFDRPSDRLKQMLWRGRRTFYRQFWALHDVSLSVRRGEILGIVGRNGAGKSTLLQLLCGTLTPTGGSIVVNGRIAALLELGAGFNPEFTGRENVKLSAAILGLSTAEIDARFEEIVDFSGVREFIDQPVKTYSSGMYVRLAFAIATSVDPDILVIDEALSVGDGAFARKSFDRIMALKDAGKTILFCSHSMYQIDVLCQRALWLDRGEVRMLDTATRVTSAYNTALAIELEPATPSPMHEPLVAMEVNAPLAPPSAGRIVSVQGFCDGESGTLLKVRSLASTLTVTVEFVLDPSLPLPTVALGIENAAGISVSSVISTAAAVTMDAHGRGRATVVFPQIPLLKGEYRVSAYLACERKLHSYDMALQRLILDVSQDCELQGVVVLPHHWQE